MTPTAFGSGERPVRRCTVVRLIAITVIALTLGACARSITLQAKVLPEHAADASSKKVVYVYTDADRQKEAITQGGGGDRVSYYPYRDFERAFRGALSARFADVSSVGSATDAAAIRQSGASFVFVPTITTSSSSPSLVTWPPTLFTLTVSVDVLTPEGSPIVQLRVVGEGAAEFSEFKSEFGLAGRRAAENAARSLADEIGKSPLLR